MTGELTRLSLPLIALVAGSWYGLGRPSADTAYGMASSAARRALPSQAATPIVDTPPAPPVAPLSPLSGGELPDPVPWPRLNTTASSTRAWLLAEGPARSETYGRRFVTFTFDDGPSPETLAVLRILERYEVKATFFLIGRYLDGDEPRNVQARAIAKQIHAAGHLIGNHTHDHELLTNMSKSDALRQIDAGEASVERAIGKKPILFRPPYGGLDVFTEEALRRRGAELVLWSIEAGDWTREDDAGMADSLITQIEYTGGGTVLLHDVRANTVAALPKVLDHLKKRKWDPARPERVGFSVVDLPTFLRETEKSPQPFADRTELERARSQNHVKKKQTARKTAPDSRDRTGA